jgi:hypothetical protein
MRSFMTSHSKATEGRRAKLRCDPVGQIVDPASESPGGIYRGLVRCCEEYMADSGVSVSMDLPSISMKRCYNTVLI